MTRTDATTRSTATAAAGRPGRWHRPGCARPGRRRRRRPTWRASARSPRSPWPQLDAGAGRVELDRPSPGAGCGPAVVGHDEQPGHRPVVGSQEVAAERQVGREAVVDPHRAAVLHVDLARVPDLGTARRRGRTTSVVRPGDRRGGRRRRASVQRGTGVVGRGPPLAVRAPVPIRDTPLVLSDHRPILPGVFEERRLRKVSTRLKKLPRRPRARRRAAPPHVRRRR